MMNTKQEIIHLGDQLIREKGYNAFSFSDISKKLNIKNASIHYHFPTKTSLGIAVVEQSIYNLERLIAKHQNHDPLTKLHAFFGIYDSIKTEDKICIVGSLATDLFTVDEALQQELKRLVDQILTWVTAFLQEGKEKGAFHFKTSARTKALMIISNMLAAVQLTRVTEENDFQIIKETIINDLTQA